MPCVLSLSVRLPVCLTLLAGSIHRSKWACQCQLRRNHAYERTQRQRLADQGKVIDRMELELGLALPNPHQPPLAGGGELVGLLSGSAGACGKKRVFGGAFGAAKATLLPLFVPEDGDGGGGDRDDVDHDPSNK